MSRNVYMGALSLRAIKLVPAVKRVSDILAIAKWPTVILILFNYINFIWWQVVAQPIPAHICSPQFLGKWMEGHKYRIA